MIHNMIGGGAGSSELVVIGRTTRPEKPTENMVWVATEREVTDYVFSASEPANPVEGMVQIATTDSNGIEVTAPLKGDYIKLRMNRAKQYINGAWKTVRVWMYKDGEWEKMLDAAYGFITVTYPAGSTCTCTDGNTVLVADDESGNITFVVPNAGVWTVTATDGELTKSETVEITEEDQSVSVELSFELWLFKDGNHYENITGGWETAAKCSSDYSLHALTIADTISYSYTSIKGQGFACTKNKISLKKGDIIRVNCIEFKNRFQIYVASSKAAGWIDYVIATYIASDSSLPQHDLAITSDMEGYILVGGFGGTSAPTASGVIDSVQIARA